MTTVALGSGSSWTAPAGCILLDSVECYGAGGSGGCQVGSQNVTGGGGGAYAKIFNFPVTPGVSYSYSIGQGGPNQTLVGTGFAVRVAGSPGGKTWFNSEATVMAIGGNGGNADAGNVAVAGGLGGSFSSSNGTVRFSGGNGGSISSGTTMYTGGGGGAGTSGDGGTPPVNSSVSGSGGGGNGGDGGSTSSPNGHLYGGAGAAGSNISLTGTAVSGTGAQGLIIITYTIINVSAGFNMPMLGM